jgi:formylglycine-generating enzyme required for sulfatase activity
MKTNTSALVSAALLVALGTGEASAVTVQWSPVGNAGNAADPATGSRFGAVPYAYNIGTKDVTAGQYVEFLNTKDAGGLNLLGLYNTSMSDATHGGINFNNVNPPGSMYSVISGRADHPANFVNWFDTVRFANWLNNGQGNGDTENGAYTLLHDGSPTPTPIPSNGNSVTRNAGATVFLPSENEWYKAAYYDPRTTAQGGPPSDSHYWLYPTSSNLVPTASGPTALPNHANFSPGGPDTVTDVGAYSGTTSPYGAFDMGGNVFQWNETILAGLARVVRGGGFIYDSSLMLSSFQGNNYPEGAGSLEADGFRLASVPEPSTGVLAVMAFGMMWWWRKRFK